MVAGVQIEGEPKPLRGFLAGAAGGLLAAWMMNQFQGVWSKVAQQLQPTRTSPQEDQTQQQNSEESEDATMKAAGKLAKATLGESLNKEQKKKAGPAVHYAFGTISGAIYGLVSEYAPITKSGFGTLFGATLFLLADEIAVPALGLSKRPTQYPISSHVYGLASHFVYGVSTEAVRRGIRRVA